MDGKSLLELAAKARFTELVEAGLSPEEALEKMEREFERHNANAPDTPPESPASPVPKP